MTDYKIRCLPVLDKNMLVGIVTRGNIRGAEPSVATSLSIWEFNYIISRLRLKDIMTETPITIEDTATVEQAAKIMLEKKVSGLPVIGSDGSMVGIITESDIFRLVVKAWYTE